MPPFDWMEPKRNPALARAEKAKRQSMYETELQERAALLHRLGHARAAARARLAARVAWDFEGRESPVGAKQLDAIVDRVYGGEGSRTVTRNSGKGAPK